MSDPLTGDFYGEAATQDLEELRDEVGPSNTDKYTLDIYTEDDIYE